MVKELILPLELDSSQSQSISPRIDESSANLSNLVLRSLILQSFVYKVKRTGDSTQPWGGGGGGHLYLL